MFSLEKNVGHMFTDEVSCKIPGLKKLEVSNWEHYMKGQVVIY
jgi:hypothetical protein